MTEIVVAGAAQYALEILFVSREDVSAPTRTHSPVGVSQCVALREQVALAARVRRAFAPEAVFAFTAITAAHPESALTQLPG